MTVAKLVDMPMAHTSDMRAVFNTAGTKATGWEGDEGEGSSPQILEEATKRPLAAAGIRATATMTTTKMMIMVGLAPIIADTEEDTMLQRPTTVDTISADVMVEGVEMVGLSELLVVVAKVQNHSFLNPFLPPRESISNGNSWPSGPSPRHPLRPLWAEAPLSWVDPQAPLSWAEAPLSWAMLPLATWTASMVTMATPASSSALTTINSYRKVKVSFSGM